MCCVMSCLLHAVPRHHSSPQPNRVSPVCHNVSDMCATCVKGRVRTMSRPDSLDMQRLSREKESQREREREETSVVPKGGGLGGQSKGEIQSPRPLPPSFSQPPPMTGSNRSGHTTTRQHLSYCQSRTAGEQSGGGPSPLSWKNG